MLLVWRVSDEPMGDGLHLGISEFETTYVA